MTNYFDGMHLVLIITVQNNYKITSDRVWADRYGIHIPEISSPTEFQWVKWENIKSSVCNSGVVQRWDNNLKNIE